jgi:hypothetical protein
MKDSGYTTPKFEPAEEWYDELEDGVEYCAYCFEPIIEWKMSCCGENHFLTGFQIKEHEKELNEIDKQMKFMHREAQ